MRLLATVRVERILSQDIYGRALVKSLKHASYESNFLYEIKTYMYKNK